MRVKTLVGGGLIVVLCLPLGGLQLGLRLARWQVRQTLAQRLARPSDHGAQVWLAFSRSAAQRVLHWEHANEFKWAGESYDVLDRRETPDSLYFRCFHDRAESQLDRQLEQLSGQQQPDLPRSAPWHLWVAYLEWSITVPPLPLLLSLQPWVEALPALFPYPTGCYLAPPPSLPDPPPQGWLLPLSAGLTG